jgi:hypothetical protein
VRSNRAEAEEVVREIEKRGARGLVAVTDVIDQKGVNAMAGPARWSSAASRRRVFAFRPPVAC